MAQQTKAKAGASKTKPRSATGSRSRSQASANGRSTTNRKRGSASSARRRTSASRGGSKSAVEQARETATGAAQSAGGAVAQTAKRLRTPALAAGAGIAGVAGGIALSRRDRRSRLLGMPVPRIDGARAGRNAAEAAKHVGSFAEKAGALAAEVRQTREAIESNGRRRSPVEVVLQGLTARR